MTEHALVTGATGFLGRQLVMALRRRGQPVRAFVRSTATREAVQWLAAQGAEVAVGNLHDRPALNAALCDVAHVFHLAGQLLVPGVPAASYAELHIAGTRTLLAACAEAPMLRRVVHCSTTGVLGPTGAHRQNENAPLRPSNIYEWTKAVGERLALATARHGLPLVVARPALVYGPGDLHLLGWFRAIKRGLYRVVGFGDNLLHPIYIDDLTHGLLRCAAAFNTEGRVYHLVGEQALPIRELAMAIARALGTQLGRTHIPLVVARGVAALLEGLPGVPPAHLPLTRSRITFMTESRAYCGCRARDELGFVPQVDLDNGLRRTVAWYRAEGLL